MSKVTNIFTAVNQESKREDLLQLAINEQVPIQMRDRSDNNFIIKGLALHNKTELTLSPSEELSRISPDSNLSGSFSLHGERYLIETKAIPAEDSFVLQILNVFHMQRRKGYRYLMPQDYTSVFEISRLNYKCAEHKCKLLDVSTEGCAVEISIAAANFNVEDLVDARIILGQHQPIPVQGVIKNIRIQNEMSLTIGVEFNHLAHSSEDGIITAITDLQRDVYLRKAG